MHAGKDAIIELAYDARPCHAILGLLQAPIGGQQEIHLLALQLPRGGQVDLMIAIAAGNIRIEALKMDISAVVTTRIDIELKRGVGTIRWQPERLNTASRTRQPMTPKPKPFRGEVCHHLGLFERAGKTALQFEQAR